MPSIYSRPGHDEVLHLLQPIKISADAEERRDLADTVISELVRHSVAEEICVYPAMKKYLPDGDEAVDHDVEGHKELEQTMKKLGRPTLRVPISPNRDAAGTILRDHLSDGENEQFPKLRGPGARED